MQDEYAGVADELREQELPAEFIAEWTRHFARELPAPEGEMQSALIFRVGTEWLALPTTVFEEVASMRTVHSLPHRRGGRVLGVTNVRGELLICISLGDLLGIQKAELPSPSARQASGDARQRLLVLSREKRRIAIPVDEVHGTHRFSKRATREAPATVALATTSYTRVMFDWQDKSVGCIDAELLFYSIDRSLA